MSAVYGVSGESDATDIALFFCYGHHRKAALATRAQCKHVVYFFEYDSKNRRTGVKVGNQYLSSNQYNDTAGPQYGVLARTIFGDPEEPCQVINYTYDDFKRLKSMQYGSDASKKFSYEYGANGQVARVTNHELNRVVLSEYDVSNRPMRVTHLEGNTHVYTGEVTYDNHNNLARFEESVGSDRASYSTSFEYDEENKPERLKYNDSDSDKVEYTYDELGRIEKQTVTVDGHASETNYTYLAGTQTYTPENANDNKPAYATTGLIERITHPCGDFTYDYDANGNITRVVQDNVATVYSYDALGQLIRVVDGQEGATWEYTYDQGGNITSKKKFVNDVLTESMVFDYVHEGTSLDEEQERENKWRDLLKYVNGKRIYYDMIGNPLQVGENNDVDKVTYTWEKGRQLASMSKSGTTASFKYNENGLRIQKVATSTGTTNYTLHGKNIVHMTQGSNNLHFFYDASNKPAIVEYNGTKYAYVHNLQGDIVAILDSNGIAVVQYKYDAWGKPISKTGSMKDNLGTLNPFRYRGYVYDEETGLYYLNTRYYDTYRSRFINSDSVMTPSLCNNLFSYCLNTPVCRTDALGTESIAADAWLFIRQNGMNIAMADAYLPFGDMALFAMVGGAAILSIGEWAVNSVVNIYESLTAASAATVVALSAQIDWGKADKNHVLKGSKNHDPHDWSMFGIDPNDPNAWAKLLPILKKVADYGMEFSREPGNGGGEIRYYVLNFANEAADVVLKLFFNPNGGISLSDAWTLPY